MPDYHNHEEYQTRLEKLQKMQALGVDPYPAQWMPTHQSGPLIAEHEGDEVGDSAAGLAGSTPQVKVAGRLVLFRAMGKNAFAHIQDESGRIQLMFNRDASVVAGYDGSDLSHIKFVEKLLDLGDIIGVEGHLFRTQKGELTVFVKRITPLCKTLLPLPDKHAGLQDKEVRYRKRWLDLISNPEVVATLKRRSQIVKIVRDHCEGNGFMEVETPSLQSIYGGAAAKPFTTTLNSLHQDMYLRISLEIALKKLVVGGLERVFEIGKVFRNEGIDRNHNPEFTLLEAYAAYWDYNDMMRFMETLYERIAMEIFGTTKVMHEDVELDFKAPWARMTMKGAIRHFADIDVDSESDDRLRQLLKEKTSLDPLQIGKAPRGMLITFLFEELCESHLIQPIHITDHPIESTPLCKPHRDPHERKAGMVERFESYCLTHEIANAYSELNDPVIQRRLLEAQADRREAGDEEASPLDEEFIEAICQGMPPAGGIGMGIDRMVMLFTNAHSIRDVIYFPLMKNIDAE